MSLEKAIQKLTRAISAPRAPDRFAPGLDRPEPGGGFDPFGYPLGECPITDQGVISLMLLPPGSCCYATQPDNTCRMQCKDHKGNIGNSTIVGSGPCQREGLFSPSWT